MTTTEVPDSTYQFDLSKAEPTKLDFGTWNLPACAGREFFFLSQFILDFLDQATQQYKKLTYVVRKFRGLESRVSVWNSKALLERFSQSEYESVDAIRSALWMDWQTLLHETFFWKTPTYELFSTGVDQSYQEELPEIGQNFIDNQQRKGADPTRAEIENNNMRRLNHWMNDPDATASVLVWISPRGKKSEGYPGLDAKNPVMVNYYLRNSSGEVSYQQFKVWSDNTELQALQQQLMVNFDGQLLHNNLSNQIQLAAELQIIDQLIKLPATFSATDIETPLNENEDRWPVERSQFPVINLAEFNQLSQRVFEHYFQAVLSPLTNQDETSLKKQLQQLDVLFSSAFQAMLKYGEQFLPADNKQQTHKKQIEKLTIDQIFNRYQEKSTLQTNVLSGKKLTPAQIGKLKELNTFFMVSNRMFSLAQCGVFSPISLAFKVNSFAGLKTELGGLSITNKQELLKQLEQEEFIELDLTDQGATQVWMVPASYLADPGCRVGTGEEKDGFVMENGRVYGPCITPEFPFGIPLDDPLEQLAMPLTQQQYNELLHTLQLETQESQFDEIEQHLQENLDDQAPDSYLIWQTFHQIKDKILKPTLSIQELLNSDFVSQKAKLWLDEDEYGLLTSLTNAREILAALEKIWFKMFQEENEVQILNTRTHVRHPELDSGSRIY